MPQLTANCTKLAAGHPVDDWHVRGVFSMKGEQAQIRVDLPDGVYCNFVYGRKVTVSNCLVHVEDEPAIVAVKVK